MYFDLLLDGEDLLVAIVGQERYTSFHQAFAIIQLNVAESRIAAKAGDVEGADAKMDAAVSALNMLKARIKGIKYRP